MKIKISENMNKRVLTVRPEASIPKAYEYLKDCRVRHLVVVNDEEQVLGVISDRDFQRAMQTSVDNAGYVKIIGESFNPMHQVQDFMSWGTQTVHETSGLRQVALKMLENKISSVVVVDDDNKMVGFMTTDDLLWALVKLTEDDKTEEMLLDLKAQILNSPLGSIVNSISQIGI
jgi:acetoin utilization protein AcuB